MNQVFAGVTALALGLMLWALGKKPKLNLSSDIDGALISGQRPEQIALVKKVHDHKGQKKLDDSQSQRLLLQTFLKNAESARSAVPFLEHSYSN